MGRVEDGGAGGGRAGAGRWPGWHNFCQLFLRFCRAAVLVGGQGGGPGVASSTKPKP